MGNRVAFKKLRLGSAFPQIWNFREESIIFGGYPSRGSKLHTFSEKIVLALYFRHRRRRKGGYLCAKGAPSEFFGRFPKIFGRFKVKLPIHENFTLDIFGFFRCLQHIACRFGSNLPTP